MRSENVLDGTAATCVAAMAGGSTERLVLGMLSDRSTLSNRAKHPI